MFIGMKLRCVAPEASAADSTSFGLKSSVPPRSRRTTLRSMQRPMRSALEPRDATRVAADAPRVFARLPTEMQATGLGRSTIYRLVAGGAFPAPVHLGHAQWDGGGPTSTNGANRDAAACINRMPVLLAGSRAGEARRQQTL
jgi:predicted DNA-binding transcriptional regulator AlpA